MIVEIFEWLLICGYCVMGGYFWCVVEHAIHEARQHKEPQ